MAWLVVCIPLMVVAVLAAIAPLAVATRHQHRYGHNGSRPQAADTSWTPAATPPSDSSVCPICSAFVVDQATHDESVHQPVAV
jgi:hypothetical protein